MNQERSTIRELVIFALLVAIGVAGRWAQPDWEFTPIAAAAVFAGRYFSRLAAAALVPVAILAVSDLILPAYDNMGVLVVKYATMILPVFLGRFLAGRGEGWGAAWRWGLCGAGPAVTFFITTNFAVWAFQSDYPKTADGLADCYVAALPFFRSMLTGDLTYLAVLFGCAALAGERAGLTAENLA
jgi:hypothetical protein